MLLSPWGSLPRSLVNGARVGDVGNGYVRLVRAIWHGYGKLSGVGKLIRLCLDSMQCNFFLELVI